MRTVTRWVCHACKAVWFNPSPTGHCPACNGTGEEKQVKLRDDGSVDATATD